MYKFPDSLKPSIIAEVARDRLRYKIAREIPDFIEGAIALRFVSKSPAAEHWLGFTPSRPDDPERTHHDILSGYDVYESIESSDLDFVYSVVKGGPKTRPAGWRHDFNNGELSCAGIAFMMIEGCARAVVRRFGSQSDNLPEAYLTSGSSNRPGALCMNLIQQQLGLNDVLLARIYVAVVGATAAEDKTIVQATPDILRGIFENEHLSYGPNGRLTLTFPPSV